VVLHDVTRLRRLETVRRDFVANVSHELRTPITSIKGFVETLLDGAMNNPADAERFLKILAAQADRLNGIIEDLLILSRVEQDAQKAGIALEPGSIRDVLTAAIDVCHLKAAERNVQVELVCESGFRARINAALLEQAVVNLVDNAVKHSGEGQTVHVEAAQVKAGQVEGAHVEPGQVEAGQTDVEVVIRVRDHGCGISPEHLPRLFERFYRADKARSRKLGGTGLGLAIVKHIAQAHGGRATADSTPGVGSVFCLYLPAAR
jgi:two-component system phosphate regulon sensor histidine kinase PhoR